jgi:hypothetical protein
MIGGRAVLFLCVQHYKKLPAVAAVAKFSRAVVGQFFKTLNGRSRNKDSNKHFENILLVVKQIPLSIFVINKCHCNKSY